MRREEFIRRMEAVSRRAEEVELLRDELALVVQQLEADPSGVRALQMLARFHEQRDAPPAPVEEPPEEPTPPQPPRPVRRVVARLVSRPERTS
jgi:hypothetical protein